MRKPRQNKSGKWECEVGASKGGFSSEAECLAYYNEFNEVIEVLKEVRESTGGFDFLAAPSNTPKELTDLESHILQCVTQAEHDRLQERLNEVVILRDGQLRLNIERHDMLDRLFRLIQGCRNALDDLLHNNPVLSNHRIDDKIDFIMCRGKYKQVFKD